MIAQIWRSRTRVDDRQDTEKEECPAVSRDATSVSADVATNVAADVAAEIPAEVATDARRARLYARLRRRFPLRIAVPR